MPRGVGLLFCCWAMACAAPAATPRSEPASAANAPSSEAPPAKASPPLQTLPEAHTDFSPVGDRAARRLSVSAEDGTPFTRELEIPVRAIAIDKAPHVSALAERAVHVHDARGWRQEALPAAALSDAELAIFYGRDYRVRLVGTRQGDQGLETLYYRWLPGGFRAAPDEIGRLGSTRKGGFVALLGTADPEVVCRPGDVCLIKRLSGWATIAAPAELELVAIHGGGAWGVGARSLFRLDADKRWVVASPAGPWTKANALLASSTGALVLETDADMLHVYNGEKWSSAKSPAKRPRAAWGDEKRSWIGGDDGLFVHDGQWRKVSAISGTVSAIAGRGDELWVGGSAGLFRASASK